MKNENNYGFPSHLIPASKKDKDWHLQYCKAFDKEQTDAGGNLFNGNNEKFKRWRSYARAEQDIEQYKDMLGIKKNNGKREDSWRNLDYNILAIFPKFKKIILHKILNNPKEIVLTAIDSQSVNKERDRKIKMKEYLANKDLIQQAEQDLGQKQESPFEEGAPIPKNDDEIDFHMRMYPKNRYLLELKDELDLNFEVNNWEESKKNVVRDLVEVGLAGTRQYIDSNGFIKVREIVSERFASNKCVKEDFSDIIRGGEYIEMTISDLRQRVSRGTFTEEDYAKMAAVSSKNKAYNTSSNTFSVDKGGQYPYDHEVITVLDAEWFSADDKAYVIGDNKYGNEYVKEMENPYWLDKKGISDEEYSKYQSSQGKKRTIERTTIKNVYKASYIVGTDYIFDYGLQTNMKRAESNLADTKLSFTLYTTEFDSLMRECEPLLDNIQLNWLQFQHHLAQSKPSGIAIEKKALGTVQIGGAGGQKLTPQQILKMYAETGSYIYKGTDENGRPYPFKPIEELKGGISDAAQQHLGFIIQLIDMLRQVLGINEVEDASTPNPDILKSVAEMASIGTNNALGNLFHAYGHIFEHTAKGIALLLPESKIIGGGQGIKQALGENSYEFWSDIDEVGFMELSVKIEDGNNQELREVINGYIQASLKSQGGSLLPEDAILLHKEQNLERKYMMLTQKRIQREEEEEGRQARMYKMEEEKNINSSSATEQARQKTLQMEMKFKMRLESTLSELRKSEDRERAKNAIILKKVELGAAMDKEEMIQYNKLMQIEAKGGIDMKIKKIDNAKAKQTVAKKSA
jgi:hypothetical protein